MLRNLWNLSFTVIGFAVIFAVAPKFAMGLFTFLLVMAAIGFIGIQINKDKEVKIKAALEPLKNHQRSVLIIKYGVQAQCFYMRSDDKYYSIITGSSRGSKRIQGTYEYVEECTVRFLVEESLVIPKRKPFKLPWKRN